MADRKRYSKIHPGSPRRDRTRHDEGAQSFQKYRSSKRRRPSGSQATHESDGWIAPFELRIILVVITL